jgi:hypothetical protein
VLPGLKLAERDARRGLLDDQQTEKITDTVKEMLDNLSDFEPRRWFSQLRPKARDEEEETGLASLAATESGEEEELPVVARSELAPGWVVDEPILSIGGRTALDEAAAAVLAEVLKKRGLGAKVLEPDAISAAHIASLAGTEAKLICLSYLGLGTSPAPIRYLVRRLRRILPQGTHILVCYWGEKSGTPAAKEMLQAAEADAYALSLSEAVELCVKAAKGEVLGDANAETPPLPEGVTPLRLDSKFKPRITRLPQT